MKISSLVFISFLSILGLFSATTYINFRQAEKVNENSEFFAKSTAIVRQSNRFQRNILNMISGLRGYLLSGERYFIQAYDSAAMENVEILNELQQSALDFSQQRLVHAIARVNEQWLDQYAQPLIAAKNYAFTSDSANMVFKQLYKSKIASGSEAAVNRRLQSLLRDFSNYEYQSRDIRKAELTSSVAFTRKVSFYLNMLSVIVGLAIAGFLAKRISTRIVKMVKMADDIAEGDYHVQTTDTGKDEISHLARSLNRMAKTLAENINLLQRKNEELGQFAHIVSHDLKAPLRGIDNVVTWIEEDHAHELSPKVAEYLRLIKGRLLRAENLIQGILQYSRVGRDKPEKEEVNLRQLIDETIENISANDSFQFDIPKRLPVISTEKIPLQQVLSNLISNAVKYHDKTNGKIKIDFKDKLTHYEFTVEDNGPGIDKNYHEKIFIIFQTLQERDTFESTGVGLAIVKKILDDRKQTIAVHSSPGKGSAFVFTWPK